MNKIKGAVFALTLVGSLLTANIVAFGKPAEPGNGCDSGSVTAHAHGLSKHCGLSARLGN